MANRTATSPSSTLRINDRVVPVAPRETLLATAERHGIALPSSCRVGSCGTCKCRLVEGEVDQLTETAYLLTAEEIERGYILACQSVPRSPSVAIEAELESPRPERGVRGRVVAQAKVTHDITRLDVQLAAPLAYRAGQFARLSLDGLDGVERSYSFATPARGDGLVSFYIRKVPGGRMSTVVDGEDLRERGVRVDGPDGDFWLRPAEAPLVLVAGGSGLPPILAILEDALAAGVRRPVTLLFGARAQRDLYALVQIASLAARWPAPFRFVPVLSAADDDAAWTGARGLVTDVLPAHVEPGAHAYLCGPPAMIDAAVARLGTLGVERAHIHYDRFTTQADVAAAAPRPVAGVFDYLKYFAFHAIGLLALLAILLGRRWDTRAFFTVLALYMLGDAFGGDDTRSPRFTRPRLLTAQLWLALPLLAGIVFAATWSMCAGDPLGFGAWLTRATGYDFFAARAATTVGQHVSAWLLTGLMIGMIGTITAHELTHRTWDRGSMLIGRWLLAFSFDTSFAIEHVYGHHRYVATTEDPATAPRGRNVYAHIVASTIKGNVSAWRIEAERLAKQRRRRWSLHNAFLRGQLMSLTLLAGAYAMGGWRAAAFFVACALWGKALLEIVNYMEHYGMVRDPATPVQPRHSWNTNRRVSSWTMFNLTRHSHHHAQGEVPYQDLEAYPDAPMMISGYLNTIVIAMIPPLWHALMTPRVLAWDRQYASADERALAAAANARSGRRALADSSRRATSGSPAQGAT